MKETTQCKLGAYFYVRNKYAQEKWPLGGGIVLYFNFLLTFFPTLTRNMPLLPQFKIVVSNFVVLLLLWNMNQSHLIGQETATVSSLPDGESFVPPGQDSRHPLRCLVPFPNFRPSHRFPEPSVPLPPSHSKTSLRCHLPTNPAVALLALLHADTSGLEPFPTGVPKLLEGRGPV